MKRLFVLIPLIFLGSILTSAGSSERVFHGEISDSQCALNVHSLSHSHKEMLAKHTFGTDEASCARACVRRGGEWVLRSGDVVYHLANQDGLDEFSAQQVRVFGTLDSTGHTIDNTRIEPDNPPPAK